MIETAPVPVPLAIVLACASAATREVIVFRAARGDRAIDPAKVIADHGRYWAAVSFDGARFPDLVFALDVWTRTPLDVSDHSALAAGHGLAALRGVAVPVSPPNPSGAS